MSLREEIASLDSVNRERFDKIMNGKTEEFRPSLISVTFYFPDYEELESISLNMPTVPLVGQMVFIRPIGRKYWDASEGYNFKERSVDDPKFPRDRWEVASVAWEINAPASSMDALLMYGGISASVKLKQKSYKDD